ncbi:DUF1351 domain-containing protein [Weissella hellenica]|nr:DUF1351 domain-containing protein [Weissella hellenica]
MNEIEVLDVKVTPAQVIVPNLDDVVAHVDEMLASYEATPVSAKTYKEAKAVRADLNKAIKRISDVRKDTKKRVVGNWNEIEQKMMQAEKAGKSVSDNLGQQLKTLDDKAKTDREETIKREASKIASEFGVDPTKIQIEPKWLNKTANWADTEQAIRSQCEVLKQFEEIREFEIKEIEHHAEVLGIRPEGVGGYVGQLDVKNLDDIKANMRRDVQLAKARFAAKKAEEEAAHQQALEREKQATKVGNKLVDANTGEVVKPAEEIRRDYQYTFKRLTEKEKAYMEYMFNQWNVSFSIQEF